MTSSPVIPSHEYETNVRQREGQLGLSFLVATALPFSSRQKRRLRPSPLPSFLWWWWSSSSPRSAAAEAGGGADRMKPSPLYSISMYQQELMEEEGVLAVGMEVDDADTPEIFGELDRQPADADFFNAFEDDFDDTDV